MGASLSRSSASASRRRSWNSQSRESATASRARCRLLLCPSSLWPPSRRCGLQRPHSRLALLLHGACSSPPPPLTAGGGQSAHTLLLSRPCPRPPPRSRPSSPAPPRRHWLRCCGSRPLPRRHLPLSPRCSLKPTADRLSRNCCSTRLTCSRRQRENRRAEETRRGAERIATAAQAGDACIDHLSIQLSLSRAQHDSAVAKLMIADLLLVS